MVAKSIKEKLMGAIIISGLAAGAVQMQENKKETRNIGQALESIVKTTQEYRPRNDLYLTPGSYTIQEGTELTQEGLQSLKEKKELFADYGQVEYQIIQQNEKLLARILIDFDEKNPQAMKETYDKLVRFNQGAPVRSVAYTADGEHWRSVDANGYSADKGEKIKSLPYGNILHEAAITYNVDPLLLASVCGVESQFTHEGVISNKKAIGLCQLMPATAKDLGVNPWNSRQNAQGAAKYLSQLLHRYNNDETLALAAYNAGMGNVDKGRHKQFSETQKYVHKVLKIKDWLQENQNISYAEYHLAHADTIKDMQENGITYKL